MIRIESERSEGEKTTPHTRYFISSTWINAKDFLDAICQHWSIENRLHWVLDVAFRADDSRLLGETRPRTSWSSSIWPAISCRTSKARKSASTSAALKPHATLAFSSTSSLHARIRCVCPSLWADKEYTGRLLKWTRHLRPR